MPRTAVPWFQTVTQEGGNKGKTIIGRLPDAGSLMCGLTLHRDNSPEVTPAFNALWWAIFRPSGRHGDSFVQFSWHGMAWGGICKMNKESTKQEKISTGTQVLIAFGTPRDDQRYLVPFALNVLW